MIVGCAAEWAVSLLLIVMGLLLWKKQKISLLHSYHYQNVKKENIRAYCRQMGIGLIIMGAGIGITGFLHLLCCSVWWISLTAGFAAGFAVMHCAQMKYNGAWFD